MKVDVEVKRKGREALQANCERGAFTPANHGSTLVYACVPSEKTNSFFRTDTSLDVSVLIDTSCGETSPVWQVTTLMERCSVTLVKPNKRLYTSFLTSGNVSRSIKTIHNKYLFMPIDPITGSLIVGGASLVGQLFNAKNQRQINNEQKQFINEQFDKEKNRDLEFWNLKNNYNHPSAQMARLREAGLNPNLIYQNGAQTAASAPNTSGVAGWNPRAPETDFGGAASDGLATYFNAQMRTAQLDNLREQNTVLQEDAALKRVTQSQILSNTAKTDQEVEQSSELFQYNVDALKESIRKTTTETDIALQENERRELLTSNTLQQGLESILKSRSERATNATQRKLIEAQIQDVKNSAELKQLDINLKSIGLSPSDPMYQRMIGQAIKSTNIVQFVKDWWKAITADPDYKKLKKGKYPKGGIPPNANIQY